MEFSEWPSNGEFMFSYLRNSIKSFIQAEALDGCSDFHSNKIFLWAIRVEKANTCFLFIHHWYNFLLNTKATIASSALNWMSFSNALGDVWNTVAQKMFSLWPDQNMSQLCLFCLTPITYFIHIRVNLRQSSLTVMNSMKDLELN